MLVAGVVLLDFLARCAIGGWDARAFWRAAVQPPEPSASLTLLLNLRL